MSGDLVGDEKRKAVDWLLGQPAVVVVLIAILFSSGYAIRWMVLEGREFARTEIPKHIEAINAAQTSRDKAFIATLEKKDADQKAEREENRKWMTETIERIERFAGLAKKPSTGSVGSSN